MLTELEALRLQPGELLVLRTPRHVRLEDVERFKAQLDGTPFDGRVLIVADEIEPIVLPAPEADHAPA